VTNLDKPVRRVVPGHYLDQKNDTVVSLYPDGTIGFREKGKRKEFTVSLSAAYWLAVKRAATEIVMDREAKC